MPIDMSLATSKAPPARQSSAGKAKTSSTRQTIGEKRTEAVAGLFQLTQYGLILTKNYADAAAIGIHGEPIATEIANLAAQEEKVAKVVDYLLEVGPYAGLVAVTMPLILQLAANHKLIPGNKVSGVVPPDVLEARMEATLERQAAQQLAEANQMRQEAYDQRMAAERDMAAAMEDASQNGSKLASDAQGMQ